MYKLLKCAFSMLLVCVLMLSTAFAAEAVTITGESITSEAEDLVVDYNYPTFTAEDATLADALNTLISQPCLDWYNALYAEYEAFAADRTEDVTALYAGQETYYDTIIGEYQILSNDENLVQILTPTCYQPAGGNGNWWTTHSYIFDVRNLRLLAPADLFEEDADTVYAELSRVVAEKAAEFPGLYDDAQTQVDAQTPFYFTVEENTLHLIFNPYTLTKNEEEIMIGADEVALTMLPVDALPIPAAELIASMPNPMREATAEELKEAVGVAFAAPENATDVTYFLYEYGPVKTAEMNFTVDGNACTFRAEAADAFADLSGMYIDFATESEAKIGENDATIKLNEGAEGICIWHDAAAGLNFSLTMMTGASVDALSAMANSLL